MSKAKKLIRDQFRTAVFKRDRNKCRICQKPHDQMDAHHITDADLMPAGGYVVENGISLCPEDHIRAERFHSSGGTQWEPGMHPDDLYRLIGSSKEIALAAATRFEAKLARLTNL